MRAGALPENKGKSRYSNILPFDDTRVVLSLAHGRGSDFINADWVCGLDAHGALDPHAFIATQGPMRHTIDDFWRMVWETGAHTIIMLGREKEMGKTKVDRYWPRLPSSLSCGSDDSGDDREKKNSSDGDDDEEEEDDDEEEEDEDDDEEEDPSRITEAPGVLVGYTMAVKAVSEEMLPGLGIIVRRFKLIPTRVCEPSSPPPCCTCLVFCFVFFFFQLSFSRLCVCVCVCVKTTDTRM